MLFDMHAWAPVSPGHACLQLAAQVRCAAGSPLARAEMGKRAWRLIAARWLDQGCATATVVADI